MVGSYLLSSTFVPVLAVWTCAVRARGRTSHCHRNTEAEQTCVVRSIPCVATYDRFSARALVRRNGRPLVPFSLSQITAPPSLCGRAFLRHREIFLPIGDTGQFQLHLRAPLVTLRAPPNRSRCDTRGDQSLEVGPTMFESQPACGFVARQPPNYSHQYHLHSGSSSRGKRCCKVRAQDAGAGIRIEDLKERLRKKN